MGRAHASQTKTMTVVQRPGRRELESLYAHVIQGGQLTLPLYKTLKEHAPADVPLAFAILGQAEKRALPMKTEALVRRAVELIEIYPRYAIEGIETLLSMREPQNSQVYLSQATRLCPRAEQLELLGTLVKSDWNSRRAIILSMFDATPSLIVRGLCLLNEENNFLNAGIVFEAVKAHPEFTGEAIGILSTKPFQLNAHVIVDLCRLQPNRMHGAVEAAIQGLKKFGDFLACKTLVDMVRSCNEEIWAQDLLDFAFRSPKLMTMAGSRFREDFVRACERADRIPLREGFSYAANFHELAEAPDAAARDVFDNIQQRLLNSPR